MARPNRVIDVLSAPKSRSFFDAPARWRGFSSSPPPNQNSSEAGDRSFPLQPTPSNATVAKIPPSRLQWLLLSGLPRTALPSDVARLMRQMGVTAPFHVSLDYVRYEPTGRAWAYFSDPDQVPPNSFFSRASLSGFPLTCLTIDEPEKFLRIPLKRHPGSGPAAGTNSNGRDVLIRGTRRGRRFEELAGVVRGLGFKMRKLDDGREIHHVDLGEGAYYDRVVVHFESASEAHRFVQTAHMTDLGGSQEALIRASIIH